MRVIWLDNAAKQLDSVYEFLAQDSHVATGDIYNTIIEETDKLTAFPEMAPVETSLVDAPYSYRALIVKRVYKVIYRFDSAKEEIIVVSVWDCRQKPEALSRKILQKKR